MSRNSSSSPKPDQLELNLYTPRPNTPDHESPLNSNGSETMSSAASAVEGSCVSSSEIVDERRGSATVEYYDSNGSSRQVITRSMMLVGCPRCLMYVMLSEEVEPKCPICNSKVLLDLSH